MEHGSGSLGPSGSKDSSLSGKVRSMGSTLGLILLLAGILLPYIHALVFPSMPTMANHWQLIAATTCIGAGLILLVRSTRAWIDSSSKPEVVVRLGEISEQQAKEIARLAVESVPNEVSAMIGNRLREEVRASIQARDEVLVSLIKDIQTQGSREFVDSLDYSIKGVAHRLDEVEGRLRAQLEGVRDAAAHRALEGVAGDIEQVRRDVYVKLQALEKYVNDLGGWLTERDQVIVELKAAVERSLAAKQAFVTRDEALALNRVLDERAKSLVEELRENDIEPLRRILDAMKLRRGAVVEVYASGGKGARLSGAVSELFKSFEFEITEQPKG